jgi:hypothetical protein
LVGSSRGSRYVNGNGEIKNRTNELVGSLDENGCVAMLGNEFDAKRMGCDRLSIENAIDKIT